MILFHSCPMHGIYILVWVVTLTLYWGYQSHSLMVHHSTKIPVWKFGNSMHPMERYIPVEQTQPKPQCVWLLYLKAGYRRVVLRTTILSINGRGHFGRTEQNDQTGQSGPPYAGQTEPKWFIPLDFRMKFPELCAERKVLINSTSPQILRL